MLDDQDACQSKYFSYYSTMSTKMTNHPSAPDDPHGLVKACRELHAAVDALDAHAADRLGITRNDLRCLNLLEAGSIPAKEVASALGLTSGSVTALLDRLERKGLIERKPHPTDRRGLLILATRKVYDQLAPIYRRMGEEVVALSKRYERAEAQAAARHIDDVAKACRKAVST
ncbi:MAG: MarR family transcriptional regulator [Pseudomonadota bacterium]